MQAKQWRSQAGAIAGNFVLEIRKERTIDEEMTECMMMAECNQSRCNVIAMRTISSECNGNVTILITTYCNTTPSHANNLTAFASSCALASGYR
jgi:hypothetical protein